MLAFRLELREMAVESEPAAYDRATSDITSTCLVKGQASRRSDGGS
jgi:hypothetical protein